MIPIASQTRETPPKAHRSDGGKSLYCNSRNCSQAAKKSFSLRLSRLCGLIPFSYRSRLPVCHSLGSSRLCGVLRERKTPRLNRRDATKRSEDNCSQAVRNLRCCSRGMPIAAVFLVFIASLRFVLIVLRLPLLVLPSLIAPPTNAAIVPFECQTDHTGFTKVDELVFTRLKELDIKPASVCSDAVFVRRAYLDLIGTLPSGHEAQEFLAKRDPNKRAALIDRLLERDEFADYWAMKWSDLLRVKAEFPINLWPNAAQAYYRWIHASIKQNKPYDQFVRELLTSSGSNFREPAVNFYRAMQNREPIGIAQTVALSFMGVRAEKWPTNQLAQMAVFFSKVGFKSTAEWKEEIV